MRKPDVIIKRGDSSVSYLSRWYLIPRNRFLNVYLHRFDSSDYDDALHDHPWHSLSFMLKGELLEYSFKFVRHIPWLFPVFRTAKFAHRLEVVKAPVWTLFITGPRIRQWGFYAPNGWVRWDKFEERMDIARSYRKIQLDN